MITVDSRTRDPKTEMVVKYESLNGVPIQYKPIRRISPDITRLSPLARFIVENEDGTYVGGFNHRKNDVRVEGPAGSHPAAGDETWNIPSDARAVCPGYLFPVFEPRDDETEYFNAIATKIAVLAGNGGRVIIRDQVFEVAQ